jgi:hypothetical protein
VIKACAAQCIDKGKEIVEMEIKLKKDKDGLNSTLETVWHNPVLRTDCSYVKIK